MVAPTRKACQGCPSPARLGLPPIPISCGDSPTPERTPDSAGFRREARPRLQACGPKSDFLPFFREIAPAFYDGLHFRREAAGVCVPVDHAAHQFSAFKKAYGMLPSTWPAALEGEPQKAAHRKAGKRRRSRHYGILRQLESPTEGERREMAEVCIRMNGVEARRSSR